MINCCNLDFRSDSDLAMTSYCSSISCNLLVDVVLSEDSSIISDFMEVHIDVNFCIDCCDASLSDVMVCNLDISCVF